MAAKGKSCASHRAAQKKYVAKNPAAQRQRVAKHYKANASSIKSAKKKASKGQHRPAKPTGAKPSGRPKSC